MSIFNVLSLIGGLALFLYGMNSMGEGLSKAAGSRLESILEKLTNTPVKGVLLGALVTAVIQSSSATTVMVVGFVNSGIMKLSQAVGIIMGANIGTTATSWILSLSGLEGDALWIQLLKPTSFSPILAMIGIIFLLFTKDEKKHDIGQILLGFAVLMFGMDTMSSAVEPLADVPEFTNLLLMFRNPLFGMLAGIVLTAVIQSSSASVGILQALCVTGSVSFGVAIPIIMGQNIGTCVTAMLSAIGAKKNAKRAAFVHLYFNLIGTILFMVVFYFVNAIRPFAFLDDAANAAGIAVVHSVFNITATLVLLPMHKALERLAIMTVRDNPEDEDVEMEGYTAELAMLDERFLERPAFAVAQTVAVSNRMAQLTEKSIFNAIDLYENFDEKKYTKVLNLESAIDVYEDKLNNYLVKLSSKTLNRSDSEKISMILQVITNMERISDHALNISQIAQKMKKKDLAFSNKAKSELEVYIAALKEVVKMTTEAFADNNMELAKHVEPLEEVIDGINKKAKKHHIKRLQKGKCDIGMSVWFEDLLINFERVSDHCSNVALAMIQEDEEDVIDAHEYIGSLKDNGTTEFVTLYDEYKEKYHL